MDAGEFPLRHEAHEQEPPTVDIRMEDTKSEKTKPRILIEHDIDREITALVPSEPKESKILTNKEVIDLLSQAEKLSTADEIHSFLRKYRISIKTQEFNSLIQELQNDAAVERAYGNNKSTAVLHIDLYRKNTGMQTDAIQFG